MPKTQGGARAHYSIQNDASHSSKRRDMVGGGFGSVQDTPILVAETSIRVDFLKPEPAELVRIN